MCFNGFKFDATALDDNCLLSFDIFDIGIFFCRWTLAKLLLSTFNLLTAYRDVVVAVAVAVIVVEVVADRGALPVND